MNPYSSTALGARLESAARTAAPYVAAMVAAAMVATAATYRAGFSLGAGVHALNDWLAAIASSPHRQQPPAAPRQPQRQTAAAVPALVPIVQPAAVQVPGQTVATLRQQARAAGIRQAGGRPIKSARRADLLAVLAAV